MHTHTQDALKSDIFNKNLRKMKNKSIDITVAAEHKIKHPL